MTRDPKTSEILAHWHFSPEEWRVYVEFEKEFRQNEFGDFFQKAMPYKGFPIKNADKVDDVTILVEI